MNIILEKILIAWAGSFITFTILNYLTKDKLNNLINEWERENPKLNTRIIWIYIIFPLVIGAISLISLFFQ